MSGSVTEKVAPFPGPGAVGLDRPAVLLDEMAHDRQAEAEAAVHAGVGGVGLGEAIEDVRQEPGLDAGPGVAHLDAGAPVHLLEGDGDVPALGAELDRVGEQVRDHLLQARGIARDRADGLVEDDVEVERLALDRRR